jgi:hypothetical protein
MQHSTECCKSFFEVQNRDAEQLCVLSFFIYSFHVPLISELNFSFSLYAASGSKKMHICP